MSWLRILLVFWRKRLVNHRAKSTDPRRKFCFFLISIIVTEHKYKFMLASNPEIAQKNIGADRYIIFRVIA